METKFCHKCQTEKSVDEFRNSKRAKDGFQTQCTPCMDAASENWRKQNQERKNTKQRERRHYLTQQWRDWKQEQGCLFCEEKEPCCLELHHTDPDEKEINPADMASRGWTMERMLIEAEKGVVVCSNCHRKVHEGILEIEIISL